MRLPANPLQVYLAYLHELPVAAKLLMNAGRRCCAAVALRCECLPMRPWVCDWL